MLARREEREIIFENHLKNGNFDALITSYEGANICKSRFSKIKWHCMIIDEAHRIKNEFSKLSLTVRQFKTKFKLLLTGTPLQNNLHELWALLNYLLPGIFTDSSLFDSFFEQQNQN